MPKQEMPAEGPNSEKAQIINTPEKSKHNFVLTKDHKLAYYSSEEWDWLLRAQEHRSDHSMLKAYSSLGYYEDILAKNQINKKNITFGRFIDLLSVYVKDNPSDMRHKTLLDILQSNIEHICDIYFIGKDTMLDEVMYRFDSMQPSVVIRDLIRIIKICQNKKCLPRGQTRNKYDMK